MVWPQQESSGEHAGWPGWRQAPRRPVQAPRWCRQPAPGRGRLAGVLQTYAEEQGEIGDVEGADTRSRLVTLDTLIEPVVSVTDVVECRQGAVTEDVLQEVHLWIPEAHPVPGALRQQRADAVELRCHETGTAFAVLGAAIKRRHVLIAGFGIRIQRDVGYVPAPELAG